MPRNRVIHIRRLDNRESVKEIVVSAGESKHNVHKAVLGILRNLNTEEYFVDSSEAYPEDGDVATL